MKLHEKVHLNVRRAAFALISGCALLGAAPVAADFPDHPISVYLPLGPGGATDNLARITSTKASEKLGQRFSIVHRPGAGGSIASNTVANAKADGYTLLFANFATHAVTPSLFASLPYDPLTDFMPISLLASQAHLVLVPASSDIETLDDLIAAAKEKTLRYASSGIGSPLHLAAEFFASTVGLEMEHVPYESSAPALQDLIAGRIDFMFDNISSAKGFVESGDLHAVMVTSEERSSLVPDVPTAIELGLEGFSTYGWWGYMAPAGTPDAIVEQLSTVFQWAMASEEVAATLRSQGYVPIGSTAEAFEAHVAKEIAKWSIVLEEAGLKGSR